jgi:hypothetical protein
MFNFPFYLYFLIVCTIGGIFYSIKNHQLHAKSVGVFFLLLLLNESVCANISLSDRVYNFWYPIEFGYYSYFITFYLKSKWKIFFLLVIAILFIACYSHNIFHIEKIAIFYTRGYILFCLLLFLLVVFKIYELFSDEDDFLHPFKTPVVWFIFGLILNLSSFLLFGMKNFILENNATVYRILFKMNQILTVGQYLFFYGYFFCLWKYRNWTL